MQKQVITTAQAARLLGVSVRTAQLLIESGAIKSWKTPGGHRRVYSADVFAYMAQSPGGSNVAPALVILVASAERAGLFDSLLGSANEYFIEPCPEAHIAAFEIGARLPDAVIIDMNDDTNARLKFLQQMTARVELTSTRFIAVADPNVSIPHIQNVSVTTLQELPGVLMETFPPFSSFSETMADESDPSFPIAPNERNRLSALQRSGLLSTAAEPAFDRLTWLASQHLQMPVSLMTLLSSSHQHFKSRVGLDISETPRSWAVCNHTILQRDVYSVQDLANSPSFTANPAVIGPPHLRFYAGAPVFDPSGFALGSICVMDHKPRELDDSQEQTLVELAAIASDEIRTRVAKRNARSGR